MERRAGEGKVRGSLGGKGEGGGERALSHPIDFSDYTVIQH